MLNKKDLDSLEGLVLLSVLDKSSGKRQASQILNTSVDTINKYVNNLEHELGATLVNSNGRGTTLTPYGKRLLDNIPKIKEILEDVYRDRRDMNKRSDIKGEVRVGMMVGVTSNLVARDLGDFLDRYPDLRLVYMTSHEAPNITDMSYDLGISYEKPLGDDIVILYEKEVPCGFFASPEYLVHHGYPLDINDMYSNHRLIVKINNKVQTSWYKDTLKKAAHVAFCTNTSYALNEVLKNGAGIGILPLRFKDEGLVCLDNIPCNVTLTFYLFAQKQTKDIPRVRTVLNYFKDLMNKM